MTEKIIAEIKRRYPIGTVIKSLKGRFGCSGTSTVETIERDDDWHRYSNGDYSYSKLKGFVWSDGQWAEIIKSIINYEIY